MTLDSPDRELRRSKMHRLEQELETATRHVVELESFSLQRQAILSKLQSEYASFEASSSHPASTTSTRGRPLERDYAPSRNGAILPPHDRRESFLFRLLAPLPSVLRSAACFAGSASPPRSRSPSPSPNSGSKFRAAVHRVTAEALREYHDPYTVAHREAASPPRWPPAHQTASVVARPEWTVSRELPSPPRSVSPQLVSPLAVSRADPTIALAAS
jgi:hypothetical protein